VHEIKLKSLSHSANRVNGSPGWRSGSVVRRSVFGRISLTYDWHVTTSRIKLRRP